MYPATVDLKADAYWGETGNGVPIYVHEWQTLLERSSIMLEVSLVLGCFMGWLVGWLGDLKGSGCALVRKAITCGKSFASD